ncbi:hypothetical protein ACOQFO_06345 [Ureibacillus sp. MALMAid1270]|uniref:hypothetical protein n=1 Tax=Ureibacillus sp. MALMAid1270 TaxID=3411629 RepID=UPI003BA4EC4F
MIRKTVLTEQYTFEQFEEDNIHETIQLFSVDTENNIHFFTNGNKNFIEAGSTIVSLTSPAQKIDKAIEKASNTKSQTKD